MNPPKYGTEEETTENEFSELDKAGNEIKNRVKAIFRSPFLNLGAGTENRLAIQKRQGRR